MRHDSKITRSTPPRDGHQWAAGVIVIVATAVAYVGFARLSVTWTLAISTLVLIGLVAFLWAAGGGKERSGERRRS